MPARDRIIADLRASIEGIEKRPALAGTKNVGGGATGAVPQEIPQAGAGTLSEVFSDGTRDAGAALGFCFLQARGLVTATRRAVIFLQMRSEAQETGLPYGPGLSGFGLDPQLLALVRVDTIAEMLWAMEEAAGCGNVAAVIGDFAWPHRMLDFTVSRRLGLRAEAFGTALFVLRYGRGREASAADFRFHVGSLPSAAAAFDARAPGATRYRVTLEKGGRRLASGAGGQDGFGQDFWLLEWTENGFANGFVAGDAGGRGNSAARAALPGADAAGLGDRLSQTA